MTRPLRRGQAVLLVMVAGLVVVSGLAGVGSLTLDRQESSKQSLTDATPPPKQVNPVATNATPPTPEPTWPMGLANAANTRYINTTGPTSPITTRWTFPTEANTFKPRPVMANGTIYFGTKYYGRNNNGTVTLYAVDAWSGDNRWSFTPTATNNNWVTSIAVFRDTVFIGTWNGKVYALDAASGDVFWSLPVDGEVSGLTVANRALYVTSKGTARSGVPDGRVYALRALTGDEKWQFTTDGPAKGPPAVKDDTVYVSARYGRLYALDAQTGTERWNDLIDEGRDRISKPAVANGIVYVSDDSNKNKANSLYALDADTGEQRWSYQASGHLRAPPAVVNDTVYFGVQDDGLYALNAVTGAKRWHAPQFERTPVVVNGIAYVRQSRSIYALNPATGAERGRFTPNEPNAKFGSGMAVLNGSLYVGYAFDEPDTFYNQDHTAFYALGTPVFNYSNLSVTPKSSEINESVMATVTVRNTGTGPGMNNATLVVNGNVTNFTTAKLAPRTSRTVTLSHRLLQNGTYTVEIGGLTRTITVGDVVPAPTPTPDENTDDRASTETAKDTATSAESNTTRTGATPTATSGTAPGFGVGVSVVAVAVVIGILGRRWWN